MQPKTSQAAVGDRLRITESARARAVGGAQGGPQVRSRVRLGGACGDRGEGEWGSCRTGDTTLPQVEGGPAGGLPRSGTHPKGLTY